MIAFLLWCILLVALLADRRCWRWFLYPIVWLMLLPFRLIGIAVGGALALVWALVTLPARVIRHLA